MDTETDFPRRIMAGEHEGRDMADVLANKGTSKIASKSPGTRREA